MFRISKVALAVAVLLMIMTAGALAQAPNTLMYQGKLTNAALDAITEPTEVIFRIWNANSDDEAAIELWAEIDTVTPNAQGVFSIELGVEIPFLPGVFDGNVRYLGMEIVGDADGEMTPRQPITSAPYSMRSNVPGIAYSFRNAYGLTETVAAIDTLTVQVPGHGYLIIELTGWSTLYPSTVDFNWFDLSISQSPTDWNFSAYTRVVARPHASSAGAWETYSIRRFEPVTPGTYTYYVLAEKFSTYGAYAYDMHFTAMFVPSWIGSEPPLVAAGVATSMDNSAPPDPGSADR